MCLAKNQVHVVVEDGREGKANAESCLRDNAHAVLICEGRLL